MPLSLPHHTEGAGAQLLAQQQLVVLDQTGQSATHGLLTLGGGAVARLVHRVTASTAQHLQRSGRVTFLSRDTDSGWGFPGFLTLGIHERDLTLCRFRASHNLL